MSRADQVPLRMRIVIETPVPGVLHSLQSRDGHPLDPKVSRSGAPIMFEFVVRVGPGRKFFGDQVRREGPERRFVYVRIGQSAGDRSSPWTRRMKIDIHDLGQALLDQAIANGSTVQMTINGTARDGSPACATVKPTCGNLV